MNLFLSISHAVFLSLKIFSKATIEDYQAILDITG